MFHHPARNPDYRNTPGFHAKSDYVFGSRIPVHNLHIRCFQNRKTLDSSTIHRYFLLIQHQYPNIFRHVHL